MGVDNAPPYDEIYDINASGHYEVYAMVSDDDGNDIISDIQRIVVNTSDETQEHEMGQGLVLSMPQLLIMAETPEHLPILSRQWCLRPQYFCAGLCKWRVCWFGCTFTLHTTCTGERSSHVFIFDKQADLLEVRRLNLS